MTLISRILGLIRDSLAAIILGVSPYSDAFFIAFKLPNVFRRLFAEGSLNTIFVPLFVNLMHNKGEEEAKKFANEVFTVFFIILLIIVTVLEIFMPKVLYVLAPGFSAKYKDAYKVAIDLSRISLPYLFFIALATIYSSILNSLKKFAVAAILPLILNLSLIVGFLISKYEKSSLAGAYLGSIAISVAGMVQLTLIIFFAKNAGWKLTLVGLNKLSSATIKFFKNVLPVVFTAGIYQVNVFIDITIASWLSVGSITYLYYGDRLTQLPLAIIGIATSTVIVSFISGGASSTPTKEESIESNKIKLDALLFGLLLGIPAVLSFFMLGKQIVDMLFHHGAFNENSVNNTYNVLCAYSLGLVPNILIKVMVAIFCARQKAKIPFIVNINMLIVNIGLAILLSLHFNYLGIAFATSITSFISATILMWLLLKRRFLFLTSYFYQELSKGIIVIVIVFTIVGSFKKYINALLVEAINISRYIESILFLGLIGLVVIGYIIGLRLVKSSIYYEITNNFLRKKK